MENKGARPWLKAMQNGALGEARARAFLLNRFWVLERSVDVDGADLIIQRRITGRNLLDRQAPRLGVVQVKFFGTPTTSHFIHKEYVLDDDGEPREEFFVLCHSGSEINAQTYLIFARDLVEAFQRTTSSGNEGFGIAYHRINSTDRFRVTEPRLALDRIERQLELAEFTKNRRFLSWALPSVNTEIGAIEPDYREPLGNWWGNLPEGFTEVKRVARDAMLDVEHVYRLLLDVANATDPANAAKRLAEIRHNCGGDHSSWSISLPNKLDNQEFFDVCRRHKVMVDHLRRDGLLDAFIRMKDELTAQIVEFLEPHLPLARTMIHRFAIQYDPATLVVHAVESRLEDLADYLGIPAKFDSWGRVEGVPDFREHALETVSSGRVEYRWIPAWWGRDGRDALDMVLTGDSHVQNDCLDAVFACRYGEPHEIVKCAGKALF
jgi:hypothetical protein